MGVPVVTLMGDHHAGRTMSSVLLSVNLKEFIANNPDEFIAIAAKFEPIPASHGKLRSSMRERMRSFAPVQRACIYRTS